MTVTVKRVIDNLPVDFSDLEVDALAEGHRHVARFAAEFADTPSMFHAIFAGYVEGKLAGIGSITDEPTPTSQLRWRMRRLFAHRNFRRRGVAQSIVLALLQEAADKVPVVTMNATSSATSVPIFARRGLSTET